VAGKPYLNHGGSQGVPPTPIIIAMFLLYTMPTCGGSQSSQCLVTSPQHTGQNTPWCSGRSNSHLAVFLCFLCRLCLAMLLQVVSLLWGPAWA
jgi:hypothetical protein